MSRATADDQAIQLFELQPGLRQTLQQDDVTFQLQTWLDDDVGIPATDFAYGYASGGCVNVSCNAGQFNIQAGMFFALPGPANISNGSGFLLSQSTHQSWFQMGGPIEQTGRLKYIDGCSDSLLIPPTIKGDPCLNLLHIPAGIDQTAHTHPSFRCGLVVSGSGECHTDSGVYALEPNSLFHIPANAIHSFHTQDEELRIVAFHPDSDSGPTHDDHPMLNRSIIDGISAHDLRRESKL